MPRKILIIHSDELFLTMMSLRLEMEGFEPIACRSAGEGLCLFKKIKPHFVLLGTAIPSLVSQDVFDRMTRFNPAARIIPVNVQRSMAVAEGSDQSDLECVFDHLAEWDVLVATIKNAVEMEEHPHR